MIKEIQKNIHIIRLIVILFIFTALVTEHNKVTIDAKPLIVQSQISFINSSSYYQRNISYEDLMTDFKLKDKTISLIANDSKQVIYIPDIGLKKKLNRTLGKLETDDITLYELQNLTSLDLTWCEISSVEGLQYAKNLERLSLANNQLIDISALGEGNFENLTELNLSFNQINDISALKEGNFKNLIELNLRSNEINDISALKEGNFKNLIELDLTSNEVNDISVLGEGNFENLTKLKLSYNQITDVSALGEGDSGNLIYLSLGSNQIQDISVLGEGNFENLIDLYLGNNQIQDISALGEGSFESLTYLDLQDNQISDISSLGKGNFANLTSLNLRSNQITDISVLVEGNFGNLKELRLYSNQIMDISPLSDANLPNLMSLGLSGQTILLEPIEVRQGQSVKIINPVIDHKGQYIVPYNFNGRYDYNQNKLIWDYQTQKAKFSFYKYADFNSRTFIFDGDVVLPIKVVDYYREDLNKDGIIDEQDFKFISQWYNVTSDSPVWNLEVDLNRDGIIDLFDLVLISNKIDHEQE